MQKENLEAALHAANDGALHVSANSSTNTAPTRQPMHHRTARHGCLAPRAARRTPPLLPTRRRVLPRLGPANRPPPTGDDVRQHTVVTIAATTAIADPTIHGIIIYYPVFGAEPSFYGGCMDDYLRDSISPTKDVEGLCHTYR